MFKLWGLVLSCIVMGYPLSLFAGEMPSVHQKNRKAFHHKKALVIDHTCTDRSRIPVRWVNKARSQFRVWYGHTSHGSQITSGMRAINKHPFHYNSTGSGNALCYRETGGDLGHRGDLRWMKKTRQELNRPGIM